MNGQTLIDLTLMMAKLGLSALAGTGTIIGEMDRETVAHGWMTAQQFTAAYALSQLAPGPGGTMVAIPIGYHAAGVLGAFAALLGFCGPTAVIAAAAMATWGRLRSTPWAGAGRTALMPVAVGLVLAAVFALARSTVTGVGGVAIGAAAFVLIWRTRVPTFAVVLGGIGMGLALAVALPWLAF